MPSAIRTDRLDCGNCNARVIRARGDRGPLVLDWKPAPWGTVAVFHQGSGAYTYRTLKQQEGPVPPEKRHAVHQCRQLCGSCDAGLPMSCTCPDGEAA